VVNRHSAAQEIWVAAKSGGYHFRFDGSRWLDSRDRRELLAVLSDLITGQSGDAVVLS
jgi:CyaY protein